MRNFFAISSMVCLCTAILCHQFGLEGVAESLGDATFFLALLALLTRDRTIEALSSLVRRLEGLPADARSDSAESK